MELQLWDRTGDYKHTNLGHNIITIKGISEVAVDITGVKVRFNSLSSELSHFIWTLKLGKLIGNEWKLTWGPIF